ncbi:MAG: hypothetical protein ABIH83_01560 [Candidatus Micrarchaeota archaeon]
MRITNLTHFKEKHGLIANVIGYSHPSGSYYAYPLYFPSRKGDRRYRGKIYKRFKREDGQDLSILKRRGIEVSKHMSYPSLVIPRIDIDEVFNPLETYTAEVELLLNSFCKTCSIERRYVSIVGSRAIDIEVPTSDIDILIKGQRNWVIFQEAIGEFFRVANIELPTDGIVLSYAQRYSKFHELTLQFTLEIFREDRTKGYFKDKQKISFIFTYGDSEVPEALFRCDAPIISKTRLLARVADSSNGAMFPRHYVIELGGINFDVITNHWFFKDTAKTGEDVLVIGNQREGNIITLDSPTDRIIKTGGP